MFSTFLYIFNFSHQSPDKKRRHTTIHQPPRSDRMSTYRDNEGDGISTLVRCRLPNTTMQTNADVGPTSKCWLGGCQVRWKESLGLRSTGSPCLGSGTTFNPSMDNRAPSGPFFLEKSLLLNMGPWVLEKYLVSIFLYKGPGKVLIFCR